MKSLYAFLKSGGGEIYMLNVLSQKRYKLVRNSVKCDVLIFKQQNAVGFWGSSVPDPQSEQSQMDENKWSLREMLRLKYQ